jgi:hypothetical protein
MYVIFFLQGYLVFVAPQVLKDLLGSVSSVIMQAPITCKL